MITIDFKRLAPKPGEKILDMGCGEGRHTAKASEFPGTLCVGSDRSHEDLVTANKKLTFHHQLISGHRGKWTLARSDIGQLPFRDNCFDGVICSEVMEHIPGADTALKELVRVLKPGGTLIVTVPRFWPETLCWKLSREYHHTPGGHIRIYRKSSLVRQICRQGMIPKGSHHAHALHAFYWWLKCLTGVHRTDVGLVNLYHRLLVWDLMEKPPVTRILERLLNPIMGKSLVLYFQKPARHSDTRITIQNQ